MKTFWLSLLTLVLISGRAHALGYYPDYVPPLLNSISSALTTATDPKAISALNKASNSLASVDTSDTSALLKAFSKAVTGLSKSSASNEVGAAMLNTLSLFVLVAQSDVLGESNRLNSAPPSKSRESAARGIAQAMDYLNEIGSNPNIPAAAKLIIKAVNKSRALPALVNRALAEPPPPNGFNARVASELDGNFTFVPFPASTVQGVHDPVTHNTVITAQIIRGTTTVDNRQIILTLINVPVGTTTYPLGANASALYQTTRSRISINPPGVTVLYGDAFAGDTGSITITRTATGAYGTFEFSGNGGNDTSKDVTVTDGTFSVTFP